MTRMVCGSGGATPNECVHRVYLIEELSLSGEPQLPAIVKVGWSGLDPDKARRDCERGNARSLVVRYFTNPLTKAEALKVEHTVHRWLHEKALQRKWFGCPNVAFAQQAIDRALHYILNPETGYTDFLWPLTELTVPCSPTARRVASLRAHHTRALERGKVEKTQDYEQRIDRLQRQNRAWPNPTNATDQ